MGQVGLADVVGSETKPVKETFISLILFLYLFIYFFHLVKIAYHDCCVFSPCLYMMRFCFLVVEGLLCTIGTAENVFAPFFMF